jgi:hypothetical protein
MADNTVLNPGASGDTIRTLQRVSGGAKTEAVALDLGGPEPNTELFLTVGQQKMTGSVPVVPASDWVDPNLAMLVQLNAQRNVLALYAVNYPGGFLPMEVPSFLGV